MNQLFEGRTHCHLDTAIWHFDNSSQGDGMPVELEMIFLLTRSRKKAFLVVVKFGEGWMCGCAVL
ncbi:MAG: hypothetical protein DMG67_02125 [Acidobacteria bacterium]|nr:MAG: hypothetical protein DMG67_02125 [Acidobacteriota bacterium]